VVFPSTSGKPCQYEDKKEIKNGREHKR
jgi:hypothetical protein